MNTIHGLLNHIAETYHVEMNTSVFRCCISHFILILSLVPNIMVLERISGKGLKVPYPLTDLRLKITLFHNKCTVIEKKVSRDSTFTDSCFFSEVVPFRTFTLEAAKSIDAISTLAETWQFLTFIDV